MVSAYGKKQKQVESMQGHSTANLTAVKIECKWRYFCFDRGGVDR